MNTKAWEQNRWEWTKAVLQEKRRAVTAHNWKEWSLTNNLTVYFKGLEKEKQTHSRASRGKEIKIRMKI